MKKLIPVKENNQTVGYLFNCPGCGGHVVHVKPYKNGIGASWTWNGDLDKPTFRPSVLSKVIRADGTISYVCHLWVTDGNLLYLNDCTHEYSGQMIEMEEIEEAF